MTEERSVVEEAVGRAADASELFVREGIGPVMNRFNRRKTKKTGSDGSEDKKDGN